MDDVDAVVVMEKVDTSADEADATGTEETVNDSLDHVDTTVPEAAEDEDVTAGTLPLKPTHPPPGSVSDSEHTATEVAQSADAVGADGAELTDRRCMEIDDREESVDQSVREDATAGESDGECTSNSACLEAMTPSGQDHYLRLGYSPRRRSALRLSRIIARQQLLRRLSQGRNGEGGRHVHQLSLEFLCHYICWV